MNEKETPLTFAYFMQSSLSERHPAIIEMARIEKILRSAAELIEDIAKSKVNPEDEAEKWLRDHAPERLNA